MTFSAVSHNLRAATFLGAFLLLAACGSDETGADKLEDVHAGMPKDSLLMIMGKGPLTAQFADAARLDNGFRVMRYLIDAKMYEVLYYREKPGNVAEPVQQDSETPVVMADGKVLGWGWEFYVEEGMGKLKLPTPLREALPGTTPPTAQGAPQ